jgi:hypothetical protein
MNRRRYVLGVGLTTLLTTSVMLFAQNPPAQNPPAAPQTAKPQQPMGFFVTSVGKGDGANLGGLAGADAHCQALAAAAGAGDRTWRAYLSVSASAGQPAVNARDRIGTGPWANAKGQPIARDLAHLHGDTIEAAQLGNNLTKATALTEKGEPVKGFGDTPNQHDILTGSTPAGMAYTDGADHTCQNWTSNSAGIAQLGHSDRTGGGNTSWNSVHASKGCSQANLISTGGAGYLYCFAAK